MTPPGSLRVTQTPSGLEVDVSGLLRAAQRQAARGAVAPFSAWLLHGGWLLSLLALGSLWSHQDDSRRREVTQLRFFLAVAEAKVGCLEERNPVFVGVGSRAGRIDLAACVTAELARLGIPTEGRRGP